MKLLLPTLALASALSLCACADVPLPTAPSAAAAAAPLALVDGFDPAFFRAFVQNGYESPDHLEPVRRLPGPLRFYLRTQDDNGRAIDTTTLATTERVLVETVSVWSGGRIDVAEVLRGASTKEKIAGWLTIKWSAVANSGRCGRSTVGVDGGYIEFNDLGACSCGNASRIYPRVVRHELGHAMGYYHTDHTDDVMSGRAVSPEACDQQPSERERRHAFYAYRQSQ